jgi:hypothetical protein
MDGDKWPGTCPGHYTRISGKNFRAHNAEKEHMGCLKLFLSQCDLFLPFIVRVEGYGHT